MIVLKFLKSKEYSKVPIWKKKQKVLRLILPSCSVKQLLHNQEIDFFGELKSN